MYRAITIFAEDRFVSHAIKSSHGPEISGEKKPEAAPYGAVSDLIIKYILYGLTREIRELTAFWDLRLKTLCFRSDQPLRHPLAALVAVNPTLIFPSTRGNRMAYNRFELFERRFPGIA